MDVTVNGLIGTQTIHPGQLPQGQSPHQGCGNGPFRLSSHTRRLFLKDALRQKVNPVSSPLGNPSGSSKPMLQTNKGVAVAPDTQRRSSLALLGLALSVGTTGVMLPHEAQAASSANLSGDWSLHPQTGGQNLDDAAQAIAVKPQQSGILNGAPSSDFSPGLDATSINQPPQITPEAIAPKLDQPLIKHEVQAGDSVWKLARLYDVSTVALLEANPELVSENLTVGQTVRIPQNVAVKPASPAPKAVDPSDWAPKETVQLDLTPVAPSVEVAAIPGLTSNPELTALAQGATLAVPVELAQALPDSNISPQNPPQVVPVLPANGDLAMEPPSTTPAASSPIALPVPPALTTPQSRDVALSGDSDRTVDVYDTTKIQGTPAPKPNLSLNRPLIPQLDPGNFQSSPESKESLQVHRVQSGETLMAIADQYGVSKETLISFNDLDNPHLIQVNQEIVVPGENLSSQPEETGIPVAVAFTTSEPVASAVEPAPVLLETTVPESEPVAVDSGDARSQVEGELEKMRLERFNQEQELASDVVVPPPSYLSEAVEIPVNTEWESDRTITSAMELAAVPSEATPSEPTLAAIVDNEPQFQPQSSALEEMARGERETVQIAIAPAAPGEYGSGFSLSPGTQVSPQVPPLSSPDQYLPDYQQPFNGYIWPSKGVLTSGYGRRWGRMHRGIDIAGPIGTPIVAAAAGEVISAGWNSGGYGNLVKVKHGDGSITLYAHNNRILVRNGQKVKQGQQIAEMGSTGYSTGPHLHFEIHPNGSSAQNPIAFLPRR